MPGRRRCSIIFLIILTIGLFLVTSSGVSLLDEGKSDTITLRDGDSVGLTVTNNENVGESGGESVSLGVLDVANIEGTWMLFDGSDVSNSTDVVSTDKEDSSSNLELDNTADGLALEIKLDGVVDLDVWVRESNGSTVVGNDMWNLSLADLLLDDLAKFEFSFLGVNSVWLESSLDVIKDSEVLVGLLNGDNIHGSEREFWVSSDLAVNLDQTFLILDDLSSFLVGHSVLQSLLEKDVERNALSCLMWTSGWFGSIHSLEFSKVPLLWSVNSLHDFSLSFVAHFV